MKQQVTPKSLLSLTSDQIETALAKGFLRFVNSTAKSHRKGSAIIPDDLLQKAEFGVGIRSSIKKQTGGKHNKKVKSVSKKSLKGRTPIRSQTEHDHCRNHQ